MLASVRRSSGTGAGPVARIATRCTSGTRCRFAKSVFSRTTLPVVAPLRVKDRLQDVPKGQHWDSVEHLAAPSDLELQVFQQMEPLQSQHVGANSMEYLGGQARAIIDAHLPDTGALLLRNLPVTNPEACESFVRGLDYQHMAYEPMGAPRKKVGTLDAATNISATELLDTHNEMSYNPKAPLKIMLICLQPAPQGGESLIADGAAITAAIPPHVLQRFQKRGGIKNSRFYFSAEQLPSPAQPLASSSLVVPRMTWQERTGCLDKAGAAAFFRDLGFEVEFRQQPMPDTLHAWYVAPAVVAHPVSQQPLWFNIANRGFPCTTYGNVDEPIEPEIMAAINQARQPAVRAVKLQAGDMLVLDNFRYLHGRLPYTGSGRLMVTVLTSN